MQLGPVGDIQIFNLVHYTLFRAATSMAVRSTIRHPVASCGQVLRTQIHAGTTYITIAAMSSQRTAVTATAAFQSAVSPIFAGSSDFGYLLVEQGITSSFGTAGENTGWSSNGYSNIQKAPLFTTRSGYFNGGSFDYQASYGYLWSGTTYSGTNAYYLYYSSSTVYPASNTNRQNGFPVRCIA